MPDAETATKFWTKISSKEVQHAIKADLLWECKDRNERWSDTRKYNNHE